MRTNSTLHTFLVAVDTVSQPSFDDLQSSSAPKVPSFSCVVSPKSQPLAGKEAGLFGHVAFDMKSSHKTNTSLLSFPAIELRFLFLLPNLLRTSLHSMRHRHQSYTPGSSSKLNLLCLRHSYLRLTYQ